MKNPPYFSGLSEKKKRRRWVCCVWCYYSVCMIDRNCFYQFFCRKIDNTKNDWEKMRKISVDELKEKKRWSSTTAATKMDMRLTIRKQSKKQKKNTKTQQNLNISKWRFQSTHWDVCEFKPKLVLVCYCWHVCVCVFVCVCVHLSTGKAKLSRWDNEIILRVRGQSYCWWGVCVCECIAERTSSDWECSSSAFFFAYKKSAFWMKVKR